ELQRKARERRDGCVLHERNVRPVRRQTLALSGGDARKRRRSRRERPVATRGAFRATLEEVHQEGAATNRRSHASTVRPVVRDLTIVAHVAGATALALVRSGLASVLNAEAAALFLPNAGAQP